MHHFRYHFLGKAFPNGCVDISIAAKRTPYGFFAAELCRNVLNFRCHLVVYVSANCRTIQVETSALRVLDTGPYRAALDAWPLNTESIAAWAHCSPCPLETPIAPITWPFTTIGSAPGCGKSFMNVGARFSPLRTILFVSDVGRRHRNADLAFSRAVSMAFAAAPSMAWDSIRLPPQSKTAIATVCLFFAAQAEQASTRARAPALEMILMSLVICAEALGVTETPINTTSKSMESRMRMSFSPLVDAAAVNDRRHIVIFRDGRRSYTAATVRKSRMQSILNNLAESNLRFRILDLRFRFVQFQNFL